MTAAAFERILDGKGEKALEQPTRTEIEREADDHIALGLLLRKDRAEQKKSAVTKVLASELTVSQKLEKIREIDEKEDAVGLLRILRQVSTQLPRSKVSRISRTIKRPLQRLSHIAFLLREYSRVQQFGRRTHVLEARVLPPGIRMDPRLPGNLVRELQPSAADLSRRLKPFLEHGWLYLTPRQYNLVVLLKRLADRLLAFDFIRLHWRDHDLIDGFRRIESLFLMLHYTPDTTEAILEAVRLFFEKQHEEEEEIVRTSSLVLEVLAEDFALPSLYNCIVGLNIFKYRRLLTLADLMREGLGEMVDSGGFDCENQVRARVDEYIDESLQSMRKVHEQLLETRRINSFIGHDEEGQVDTTTLRRLYAAPESPVPIDFDTDQENVVLFLSRLIHSFDRIFRNLLNGQCVFEDGTRAAVFSHSFFELDFSKIRTVAENLDTGPFHFSSFPLSRYLQIKEQRLGTVGNELEGSQLIAEGVGCLVDIGKALVKVLSLRSLAGAASEDTEPLQPIILQGKPFTLPFQNRRLQARSVLLQGKTVLETLSTAVSICFTVGFLFQDDFLSLFTGKEKKLVTDLQTRMKLMENLLDPDNYRELTTLYV